MSGHAVPECHLLTGVSPEPVNYAQGNPYSNTYNPGWKNHPNFLYKNNNALYAPGQAPGVPPGYQKEPFAAPNVPRKSNLEVMIENFIATQTQTNKDFLNQNVHTNEQIKHLATKPQPNPKGHAHAIILRSGREMDKPTDPRLKNPAMFQNPSKTTEEESRPKDKPSDPKEKEDKEGETEEKEAPYIPPPPYKPPIPYPQRFEKSKSIGQFKKFVELLKQLNIIISFTEAITQMPSYVKFLKEILSNKKKLEDNETVTLTAECSAIIQN
ncbi:uncharacterized protein LOC131614045 [Vicia villosa]|uniref:uncharacterized protein LOC131614045 n=1 Tax=Vicia villosa TaxID=3911 RepID=UPI00273B7714|nr:uncharacterized protein LOC131614045 [Vicia villosa]